MVWMRLAIISSAVVLADRRAGSAISASLQHGLDLVLDHPADRDAGPVGDDARPPPARRPTGRISGVSPCSARELRLQAVQLGQQRARARRPPALRPAARRRRRGAARRRAAGAVDRLVAAAQLRAQRERSRRPAPSRPASAARAPPAALVARPRASPRSSRRALGDVDADRLLAADDARARSRSASMRRWQSSTSAGVACWLTATRAQAVSSRLTALSGSWRAGM